MLENNLLLRPSFICFLSTRQKLLNLYVIEPSLINKGFNNQKEKIKMAPFNEINCCIYISTFEPWHLVCVSFLSPYISKSSQEGVTTYQIDRSYESENLHIRPSRDYCFFLFQLTMAPHALLNKEAPTDIILKNQHDQDVNLADYIGKSTVVLFFYPKDGTLVCTKEVALTNFFPFLFIYLFW